MKLFRWTPYEFAIALTAASLILMSLLRSPGVSVMLQVLAGAIALGLIILAMASLYAQVYAARRKAEISLQKYQASEARYRRLLETAYEGIWVVDTNCTTEYVNPRMAEMLGYRVEEVIDCSIFEFMDEAAQRELQQEMQQHPMGIRGQYDLRFRHKDGSTVWTITSANPISSDEGRFRGTLAMVTDVSDRHQVEAERQQAELALRESQTLFESFMRHTPTFAFVKDEAGRYIYANRVVEQRFKQELENCLGKTDAELFSPEAAAPWRENDLAVLTTGKTLEAIETQPYPDGDRIFISFKFPLQDATGRKLLGGMSLDITDLKRLEETLRDREARISRLIDSNIIGIIFANFQGEITEANDAFLNMLGYSQADLQSGDLNWLDITPPEYLPQDEEMIKQISATGACPPFEKEYLHKDGSRIPVLIGAALLPNPEEGTVCYVLDLSDRKQAEAAVRESEARFRYMADTAPVLIWMSGPDKLYNYFNQPWLAFTGRTQAQSLGNGWTEGVHPDDFEDCLRTYTTSFDARQEFKMEYRLRRFDGEYRWVLDIGVPRFTPDGEFLGYIGSCIDIGDLKQAEAEMQQINGLLEQRVKQRTAQLETANQELEAFSYSVSHDLRAPLRHINGFVSLLQKQATPVLDLESQRYLNIISETTKRAGTMVDDLLTFSRTGRAEMRYTTVQLGQLIQDVKQDLELELAGREITWQIHLIPDVQGDPAMLRQVIYNLVENAIKYTHGRTHANIEIGTIGDEQEIVVFVRDNGLGFDMRYAHKLFGVFQRLHNEPEIQGTGIGLANVRRIIHRHGGRTWAESELDKGSTFYFSLPVRPQRGEE